MLGLQGFLFLYVILIMSAIIHEYSHGWMAYYLGDSTAKDMGRLTLNPLAHIDMWGTVLMPLLLYFISQGTFFFAYAKPVPFNPYNLRKGGKYSISLVSLSGPASNLITAVFFGLIVRFAPISVSFAGILSFIVYINVLLAVFNLIPIPPLDGSKILFNFLPSSANQFIMFMERYGMIILLAFIFFGFYIIIPVIGFLTQLIIGGKFALF